jgi:tetratricopeptide (TPR) repeat protein
MIDPRAAVQPLEEAQRARDRLGTYETPAELAEQVGVVWRAVDRSLRTLVRGDAEAPDELRLHAFAPTADTDAILTHLRRRDIVSLTTAGALHELSRIARRVEGGSIHGADADVAAAAYDGLLAELRAGPPSPAAGTAVAAERSAGGERGEPEPAAAPVARDGPTSDDRRRVRRLMLFAGAVFFVGGIIMLISLIRGPAALEREAISAFREDRLEHAERGFGALVQRDPQNVTAQLYLGRIYRRQGRLTEASEALQRAAQHAPQDPDVRRELGHLFMDLNRPVAAVPQFMRAVEAQPDLHANWIALIQALRTADDPTADEWLQRAPAEVRAALTPTAPQRPFGSN